MKISKVFTFFLSFVCQISFGQTADEKLLYGKITVDSIGVNGINILNLTSGKTSLTNNDGTFSILAKANDILVFKEVNFKTYEKKISSNDIIRNRLVVHMQAKTNELKEVIVRNKQISVFSLGIVAKEPVKYSPAERHLKTAGDFKPIMLLGILAGGMPLDPLINKINGRTKRLKKLVVVEKKEMNIQLISELYQQEYFTLQLKIAAEYINGFKYFVVENENFVKVLHSKNEQKTSFFLIALAEEYKTLLQSKN